MDTNQIIKNIFILRDKKRMLQQDLADALGISDGSYSKLEAGKRELKLSELSIIAEKLGVREIDIITYPEVYELKNDNSSIVSSPIETYELTNAHVNPWELLYECQKDLMETKLENERLKNVSAPVKDALAG